LSHVVHVQIAKLSTDVVPLEFLAYEHELTNVPAEEQWT